MTTNNKPAHTPELTQWQKTRLEVLSRKPQIRCGGDRALIAMGLIKTFTSQISYAGETTEKVCLA